MRSPPARVSNRRPGVEAKVSELVDEDVQDDWLSSHQACARGTVPRDGASSPPYQTVVYWPGWDTFGLADADEYFAKQLDFVVKSGRAVAFPIYKGIFDRQVGNARVRPDGCDC